MFSLQDLEAVFYFVCGFTECLDVPLGPTDCKQPDVHFTIDLRRILPPHPPRGTFALGAGGNLSPQLVFDIAVANESMPTLTEIDLQRYFSAGTGTRWWVGIRIFKDVDGVTRWWVGHAYRRFVNGRFIDRAELHQESMPNVTSHNVDISIHTNLLFRISVQTLMHPCLPPAAYPDFIVINLEQIRQLVVSLL